MINHKYYCNQCTQTIMCDEFVYEKMNKFIMCDEFVYEKIDF